ncbi:MAG: helix-turn-helix domain-containing protein, partial [Myxococcota bacterium]
VTGNPSDAPSPPPATLPTEGCDLDALLADTERQYLRLALRESEGNRTKAAERLGISFRSMRYRLQKLGMDVEGGD